MSYSRTCPGCNGNGWVGQRLCQECFGYPVDWKIQWKRVAWLIVGLLIGSGVL